MRMMALAMSQKILALDNVLPALTQPTVVSFIG
jgi:hypothetical protein